MKKDLIRIGELEKKISKKGKFYLFGELIYNGNKFKVLGFSNKQLPNKEKYSIFYELIT